jgi:hypothetical protein
VILPRSAVVRRIRNIALLLISLLFGTEPVYAECAWVLWNHSYNPTNVKLGGEIAEPQTWTLIDTVGTRVDCERQAKEKARELVRGYDVLAKARQQADITAALTSPATVLIIAEDKAVDFRCLPDTIDPRGPKGR